MSSAVSGRIRRTHRAFIVLLLAFVILHLAVNLTALRDLTSYNEAARWFRFIWRTPIGEPILIALLAIQMATGLALAVDVSAGRSTFEHLCQISAGLVIAVFLTSHTFAVAVLGRVLLDRGPASHLLEPGRPAYSAARRGRHSFPITVWRSSLSSFILHVHFDCLCCDTSAPHARERRQRCLSWLRSF